MNSTQNNWKHHINLYNKYINLLCNNPFVDELKSDLKTKNIERFIHFFISKTYKDWIISCIESQIVKIEDIDKINLLYPYNNILESFIKKMTEAVEIGDVNSLKDFIKNSEEIYTPETEIYENKLQFTPTPLKFVTTTAKPSEHKYAR